MNDLTPAQLARWRLIQRARERAELLHEGDPPSGFREWSDELDAEGVEDFEIEHALVLYLRDKHFCDRLWPTAVFITPGVFRQRLPKARGVM